jgi:nucleoside-diphosphate-sugar epimerase
MRLLVTGATGKVGTALITALRSDPRFVDLPIRAICHNRVPAPEFAIEVVKGSIADRDTVDRAMEGVSHVIHLATCKETPEDVMDVTVKGLFWILENFRQNATAKQFILLGGDAALGHFFYDHGRPVTEATPHRAYPGCYALSKVLEEVMVEQFVIQYGVNACCLRAPWIMEKDDFRYTLSFGDDLFGGPDWKTMVPKDVADKARAEGAVPLLTDSDGKPVKRNFVHLSDLVSALIAAFDNPVARGKTYNIAMTDPVDYGDVAAYLARSRGLPSVTVAGPFKSTMLDNARARFELGWQPKVDAHKLIDLAFDFVRPPDDPRKLFYPG